MSKTRIFALSLIAIMLVAFVTNPSKEEQEARVKEKALALMKAAASDKDKKNNELVDFGVQLFGNVLVDQFIQNNVKVYNYYFFSLTKIRWEGKESTIGGGAFKQIWLSPKIDEKAKEIVTAIKGS